MDEKIIVAPEVGNTDQGHRYRDGWIGHKRLRMVFDADVLDPAGISQQCLRAIVRKAEHEARAQDVYQSFTNVFRHRLVAVTQSDVLEARDLTRHI